MKKCLRKVFCVLLLTLLVLSPAYCGWDAWRKPSGGSSTGTVSSTPTEVPEEKESSEPQTTSSEELVKTSVPTESVSTNFTESSKNYDKALDATKEAVAEAAVAVVDTEVAPVIENMKEIVDDLVESKAALDENFKIQKALIEEQDKKLAEADKRLNGVHFGLGLSLAYTPMKTLAPGLLLAVDYKHLLTFFKTNVAVDVTDPMTLIDDFGLEDMTFELGFIYKF